MADGWFNANMLPAFFFALIAGCCFRHWGENVMRHLAELEKFFSFRLRASPACILARRRYGGDRNMNSFLETAILPGEVVSAHNTLTADALVRGEGDLGLLAISNRHNESVARVIRQNLQ